MTDILSNISYIWTFLRQEKTTKYFCWHE